MEQVVYVSRASFRSRDRHEGIEPEVGRILMQSQRNNPQRGLVGALYFGNGCFFQCLEGEPAAIDDLLQRLERDDRHTQMRILRRRSIEGASFSRWSMKYVPVDKDVQQLLRARGLERFDPYRFDEAAIDAFVGLLQRRPEAGSQALAGAAEPVQGARVGRRAELLGWSALGIATLALLLSLYVLLAL